MFKNAYRAAVSMVKRNAAKVVAGGSAAVTSVTTWAQAATPDLAAAAKTGIEGAQSSGLTVGGYVVAATAALVVVGLVIVMVKKL